MKISEAMPLLQNISNMYSLDLKNVKDFKLARKILVITYFND
jgi:hypothetical protein